MYMDPSSRNDSLSEVSCSISDQDEERASLLSIASPRNDLSERSDDEDDEAQQYSAALQAAKAIEAAEAGVDYDNPPEDHPGERQLADMTAEDEPLLDAGPAPPDYSAATAWRRSAIDAEPADERGWQEEFTFRLGSRRRGTSWLSVEPNRVGSCCGADGKPSFF